MIIGRGPTGAITVAGASPEQLATTVNRRFEMRPRRPVLRLDKPKHQRRFCSEACAVTCRRGAARSASRHVSQRDQSRCLAVRDMLKCLAPAGAPTWNWRTGPSRSPVNHASQSCYMARCSYFFRGSSGSRARRPIRRCSRWRRLRLVYCGISLGRLPGGPPAERPPQRVSSPPPRAAARS